MRRVALRALAVVLPALSAGSLAATPAAANWSALGAGPSAAKAGTSSVTNVGIARTKCQGANRVLTISWTTPAELPAAKTVTIYRGSSSNPTASIGTPLASAGSFTDSSANASVDNYYKVELKFTNGWLASGQASTTSC